MKFLDSANIAFMNLWRRKTRAVLTVLGMVIGTAAIVLMVSLGIGINEVTIETWSEVGSLTTIDVYAWRYQEPEEEPSGGRVYVSSRDDQITLDVKAVNQMKKIPGVSAVMPIVETYGYLKSGQYITSINIQGIDMEEAEAFGYELADGRMPGKHSGSNYEIVFTNYTLMEFHNPRTWAQAIDNEGNPKLSLDSRFQLTFDDTNVYDYGDYYYEGMEQPAKGKMYNISVVGTQTESMNSYMCLMDIGALRKLQRENKDRMYGFDESSYQRVSVKCETMEGVQAVQKAINEMGYQTNSISDVVQAQMDSTAQLRMLLTAVGGVALLIAAISIMNTMMMSIYERTKEIGIIKVLGCRMTNIASLFLTEAAYIGLFGGAIGLGVSYGLSHFMNTQLMDAAQMRSVIPPWLSAGAVVFSMVVAILSGMYPAFRAMRLSALSAIRSE